MKSQILLPKPSETCTNKKRMYDKILQSIINNQNPFINK